MFDFQFQSLRSESTCGCARAAEAGRLRQHYSRLTLYVSARISAILRIKESECRYSHTHALSAVISLRYLQLHVEGQLGDGRRGAPSGENAGGAAC